MSLTRLAQIQLLACLLALSAWGAPADGKKEKGGGAPSVETLGPDPLGESIGEYRPVVDPATGETRNVLYTGPYVKIHEETVWQFRDPDTGEDIYVQEITLNSIAPFKPIPRAARGTRARLKAYQRMALQHILSSTRDPTDRRTLMEHMQESTPPDMMILISKTGEFKKLDGKDIIGTIAADRAGRIPRRLVVKQGVEAWQSERMHSEDVPWTLRHLTSTDRRYTGFLLKAADMLIFDRPIRLQASADITVRADGRTMSLAEFRDKHAPGLKAVYVYPDFYQMDAFEELRGYYEGFGFREDPAVPPHGNLHHYTISRQELVGNWVTRRGHGTALLDELDPMKRTQTYAGISYDDFVRMGRCIRGNLVGLIKNPSVLIRFEKW
jgi:hypothetical protein